MYYLSQFISICVLDKMALTAAEKQRRYKEKIKRDPQSMKGTKKEKRQLS